MYSIDATYDDRLGKFVNDSAKPNTVIKSVIVDGSVHLCMFALKEITNGDELRYNYNAPGLFWRKVCNI